MTALHNLGELHRYQGDYAQAEQFYEKSLAMCREYDVTDWGLTSYSLGMIALSQREYPLARQRFTSYFDTVWPVFPTVTACDTFTGLAAVAAGTNQPERAGRLYGAAQAILETTDYRIPPFDRAEFDRHIQVAREQLGQAAFEGFVAEGRAMTLEQAIAAALGEAEPERT